MMDKARVLENTVRPIERKGELRENADEIEAAICAISGMIPDGGRSLEEYREERLKKSLFEDTLFHQHLLWSL